MASRSLAQRFFMSDVGDAITAPSTSLGAGVLAAGAILAGAPLLACAAVGVVAYAARVGFAMRTKPKGVRIDPSGLRDPWRRLAGDAVQSRRRFDEAVHAATAGPTRDRLAQIGERLDFAVQEGWRTAQQGNALTAARNRIDTQDSERELADLEQTLGGAAPDPASTTGGTVIALRAELASAARMDKAITETRDKLRLLNARLDETVARAVELSVQADNVSDFGGLGDDVESIVGDMEALRQGLDEVSRIEPGVA